MAEKQRTPQSKSGLKPGDGASPPQKGNKRPIKEDDAFGGAERTHNENVQSPNAKP